MPTISECLRDMCTAAEHSCVVEVQVFVPDQPILLHEHIRRLVKGLAGSMLAKSVHDAGWSQFISILSGKAECAGRTFVKVNPACGTPASTAPSNAIPNGVITRPASTTKTTAAYRPTASAGSRVGLRSHQANNS